MIAEAPFNGEIVEAMLKVPRGEVREAGSYRRRQRHTFWRTVRLFHPRTDFWTEHFRFDDSRLVVGVTPIGRATIHVLAMNAGRPPPFHIEIPREGIPLP